MLLSLFCLPFSSFLSLFCLPLSLSILSLSSFLSLNSLPLSSLLCLSFLHLSSFFSYFHLSQLSHFSLLCLSFSLFLSLLNSLKYCRTSVLPLFLTGVSSCLLSVLEGGEDTAASGLAEAIRTGGVMDGLPPIVYHFHDAATASPTSVLTPDWVHFKSYKNTIAKISTIKISFSRTYCCDNCLTNLLYIFVLNSPTFF